MSVGPFRVLPVVRLWLSGLDQGSGVLLVKSSKLMWMLHTMAMRIKRSSRPNFLTIKPRVKKLMMCQECVVNY